MTFFNPFKPHIAKVGHMYVVRRWRFGWEYLDKEDCSHWWLCLGKYTNLTSVEDAEEILEVINNQGFVKK